MTAITLDDVLSLCSGDAIHWLKIDVEGFEREVLAGWRDSPRRPWVVAFEATYPNTTRDTYADWESIILAKGYALVYRDGLNRYYLHQTQPDRKVRFVFPPNVFDGFQLSGKATSFTAAMANRHQQEQDFLLATKDHAQHEVARLKAEYQQLAAEEQIRQETLQGLASKTLAQQHAAAIEYLKTMVECVRVHAEKLEALRLSW